MFYCQNIAKTQCEPSFIVDGNIENVIASLEEASNALFDWFKHNRLKSNIDKCHALVRTTKPVDIKITQYITASVKNCYT